MEKMSSCFKMGFKEQRSKTDFMRNGEKLLEGMIASCGGKCNPIRSFSAEELHKATNNFDDNQIIAKRRSFKLYKGIIGNRPISVKRYTRRSPRGEMELEYSITDIVIGSQMSSHNNVLKLIGCCLENEYPMVVYEYVGDFTLDDYLHLRGQALQPLLWKCRIKVALGMANALAYLHTALRRPVVIRDVKPATVVMDANNVPKLLHFSLSVPIPEGETHVETVVAGTFGFMDPEYMATGRLSVKSDVYGFGVLLLMLLTGRHPYETAFDTKGNYNPLVEEVSQKMKKDRLNEIMDASIVAEKSWPGKEEQIHQFCALALRCVQREPEDRPTMIEVGTELIQLHPSTPSPLFRYIQRKLEDSPTLLHPSPVYSYVDGGSISSSPV